MIEQLSRADLARMTPAEIAKAVDEGRCYNLLSGFDRPRRPRGLRPDEVEAAIADGSLDELKARVQAERDEYASAMSGPPVSADQGARGGAATGYSREWLRTATSAEISKALDEGHLDGLLRGDEYLP